MIETAEIDATTGFTPILNETTQRVHQVLASPILTEWTLGQCLSQMSTCAKTAVVHSSYRSTSSVRQRSQHPFLR
jgi:hypothetical protein